MYKWEYTPTFRGFDQFYGFYGAAEDYFTHELDKLDAGRYDMHSDHRPNCGKGCSRSDAEAKGRYSTLLFTAKAVDFIERHRASTPRKPFFLYVAYQAVHSPVGVLPSDVWPYKKSISDKKRRVFAGMVSSMDHGIGNITRALKRNRIYENSLIIFSSDNGGPTVSTDGIGSRNWPLRGGKHSLYEGGTRAVAFIHGKGIRQNTPYPHLMHVVDWFATLADVAGYNLTKTLPLDSISHWRQLSAASVHREIGPRSAMVYGIVPSQSGPGIRPRVKGFGVRLDVGRKKYKLLLHNGGIPAGWCNSSSAQPSCAFVDRAKVNCPNATCLFRLDLDPQELEEVSGFPENKVIVDRLRGWATRLLSQVRMQQSDQACGNIPRKAKILRPWCSDHYNYERSTFGISQV